MKIVKSEIKKINITSLFDQVDQSQITSHAIRDLFDLKPEEKANTPFIELPGTKVLILPVSKKEVVIEPNRIRVNDSSSSDPTSSSIVKNFEEVNEKFRTQSKLIAYGFNFELLVQLSEDMDYNLLLSNPLKRVLEKNNLIEAGSRIVYKKGEHRIELQFVPAPQKDQIVVLSNVHIESDVINYSSLQAELIAFYKDVSGAVKRFIGE